MPKARTLREAFGNRYIVNADDCWIWQGPVSQGYGYVGFGGRGNRVRAHRASLILSGVSVPDEAVVLHLCDVPRCVNPAHLRVGTQSENNADMRSKGRHRSVQRLAVCKRGHPLTDDNVIVRVDGRRCRTCANARALASYHNTKAGALRFAA